jgi:hypothetical protein
MGQVGPEIATSDTKDGERVYWSGLIGRFPRFLGIGVCSQLCWIP